MKSKIQKQKKAPLEGSPEEEAQETPEQENQEDKPEKFKAKMKKKGTGLAIMNEIAKAVSQPPADPNAPKKPNPFKKK